MTGQRGSVATLTSAPLSRSDVSLVGRQRELGELAQLLDHPDVALVTLVGTGGAGKTSLALHAARGARDDFERLAIVRLESIVHARQVMPELARQLEIRASAVETAQGALKRVLRGGRLLLVLDNFEHVLDAASDVSELLQACPRVKVLATSRAPLRVAHEHVYEVTGLAYPDPARELAPEGLLRHAAVGLFVDRARLADPAFRLTVGNAQAVAALCRFLGGLPLAIELAAARAGVLSPATISARVQRSLGALAPGRRDAPERQRTLYATIDWSCALLSDEQRQLFARLGLYAGGFNVSEGEALCADLALSVTDGVRVLLEHRLIHRVDVEAGEPRYAMLEPIRHYALERLGRGPKFEEVARRQAEYYADFMAAAAEGLEGLRQRDWLAALDSEQANLRAVLDRCDQLGETELGLRIAGTDATYWRIREFAPEIGQWLDRALAQPGGRPGVRARALYVRGVTATKTYNTELAHESYRACRDLCRGLCDTRLAALCHGDQAFLYALAGRAEAAADHLQRALSLAHESWDPSTLATTLIACAAIATDYEQQRRFSEQALELMRSLGDAIRPARVNSNLGSLAIIANDLPQARASLEQAAAQAYGIWGAPIQADIAGNLGLVELLDGDIHEAHRLLAWAVATSTRIGDLGAIREGLNGLATIALREGDRSRAELLAAAAEALYDEARGPCDELLRERFLGSLSPASLAGRSATGRRLMQDEIDALIAEIVRDVDEIQDYPWRPPAAKADRLHIALFMTDIVGSTSRAAELGDTAWARLLDSHIDASKRALVRFGGIEAKNAGDGLLASFDRPEQAIRCAQAIADASRALGLEVRAGVHIGECDVRGTDVRGIAVHVVARVCALAGAGEVLVTGAVRDLVALGGLDLAPQGEKELRGVPGSWELFAAL